MKMVHVQNEKRLVFYMRLYFSIYIQDYQIQIIDLLPEETHYIALGMNYSVAGFQMILNRKMSFYIVTYYLPSGLFVMVSWISFLVSPGYIYAFTIKSTR